VRALKPPAASRIRYPCIYEPDPLLGFRYRAGAIGRVAGHFEIDNLVELNSLGFYDDEPLDPGDTDLRLLAVGDSFTAAMNVPRPDVWTSVLEAELRRSGHPRADVVNIGIDGTGTDVHLELLRRYVPRFEPDVVLVAFFANDVDDVLDGRFTRECHAGYVLSYQTRAQRDGLRARVDAHLERRALRWAFERSYLVRLGAGLALGPRNLFRLEFVTPRRAELERGPEALARRRVALRQAFEGLEALGRDCTCRLLIVPVPARRELTGSLRILRRQIADLDLEVVDVAPHMVRALARDGRAPPDLFFVHDNHLNAYGNRLFGRAVARALAAELAPGPRVLGGGSPTLRGSARAPASNALPVSAPQAGAGSTRTAQYLNSGIFP
jgi:lysophospholipase L1-like esterase